MCLDGVEHIPASAVLRSFSLRIESRLISFLNMIRIFEFTLFMIELILKFHFLPLIVQ